MKYLIIERPNEEIEEKEWNEKTKEDFESWEIEKLEKDYGIIWRGAVAFSLSEEE